MSKLEKILKEFLDTIDSIGSTPVNITEGLGRTVASKVYSKKDIPNHRISSVKGFAIIADHLEPPPTTYLRVFKSKPYDLYKKTLGPHEAVQVFPGCLVPVGADSIVRYDQVILNNNNITIEEMVIDGQNIIEPSIDVEKGEIILKEGKVLTARDLALCEITNNNWVNVFRKPNIALIANKYHINTIEFADIYRTNITASKSFLSSFIESMGGRMTTLGYSIDTKEDPKNIVNYKNQIKEILKNVDMLLTVGGIDLKEDSILWTTLEQSGASLDSFDIAIGNGEKIILGKAGNVPIIGLPDNPSATLILSLLFVLPTLKKMIGIKIEESSKHFALLTRNLDDYDLKNDFLYGFLEENHNGDSIVTPSSAQDNLMMSALSKANCIVVLDHKKKYSKGKTIEVIKFSGSLISI